MGWLKTFFRKHIVGDLPDEMNRCGDCNNTKCSNDHFDTCPSRLKGTPPNTDGSET